MVHDTGTKLKKPKTAADIQTIQDEIARLDQELREIRVGMNDNGMESIDLKTGSFEFYLGKLREIAIDWKGECTKQLVRKRADTIRDAKRKTITQKKKNDK